MPLRVKLKRQIATVDKAGHVSYGLQHHLWSYLGHNEQGSIQNTSPKIVTNCDQYSWASPMSKQLHWLPVELHCIFKTATMVYKFLHTGSPSYFGPFVSIHYGRYSARHNHPDKRFLEVLEYCPSLYIYLKTLRLQLSF